MAEKPLELSVTDAVGLAKGLVGNTPTLLVTGEVSGFRGPNARSGHCYFSVKDDSCAMDVIVWSSTYRRLGFQLKDGLEVQLSGKFDVYTHTGRLSFIARSLSVAGEGLLRQQVAALARKLQAEGLMDDSRKRHIPRFCTRVAVVTSLSGSVIDDVKRTLRRRNPLVQIDEVGCQVQGPGAPATIIHALRVAAAAKPDAILLVRGGGSFEDLMTFNDEALARAVAASPVPVVTGIGHEPDTSICDMVSDRRTSTPTAAAESVAPALGEIVAAIDDRQRRLLAVMQSLVQGQEQRLDGLQERATGAMQSKVSREQVLVDSLARHRCLTSPLSMLEGRMDQLRQTEQRLYDALPRTVARRADEVDRAAHRLEGVAPVLLRPYQAQLARSAAQLDALSPLKVLGRGYAIARTSEGHVVSRAQDAQVGQELGILLGSGQLRAQVTQVLPQEDDTDQVPAAN
ncbi:MAG: exodeoxyribonuclease VII large subunit [Atopobiaceae bacterium]